MTEFLNDEERNKLHSAIKAALESTIGVGNDFVLIVPDRSTIITNSVPDKVILSLVSVAQALLAANFHSVGTEDEDGTVRSTVN